ncbi:antibiotic biosynthesis monooxygenase [Subtercola boreus]|uniref:Antibiotic biosynthesis monooxygenase n=1 Tax=Subtercola boreus TaxID=120213 RepID=A0A3E0WEP6_9MICO|nr:antibiotic biosynthesis monooxygenase [Subtercola boreus]RFA24107.1 antibiotic biosynthesis monooxygenase [Subtercola boreus]RFA29810.1 antibiotic biosynthesis monooxygenase [Subtercola boreus]
MTALLELRIKPESVDGALGVITEVLAATRAREGNLGVEVLVDAADESHITIVEHWESIEADNAYRAWRATDEGKSALGTIVASAPVLTVNTTAATL